MDTYTRISQMLWQLGFPRTSFSLYINNKPQIFSTEIVFSFLLMTLGLLISIGIRSQATKDMLIREFVMKELGEAKKILGMEISRDRKLGLLRLTQSAYILKVLSNYNMDQSKPVATPLAQHFKLSSCDSPVDENDVKAMQHIPYASAVGSLMYLMVCTRRVGLVSRYLSNPGKNHWEVVKWILRYLNGTRNVGLVFGKREDTGHAISGFVDADFAKDLDKGRSITGYGFIVYGCLVSWKSTLQRVVALSTIEVEYVALTEAVKEALWLKGFVSQLGIEVGDPIVWCDNQGALQLSKNLMFHERTKHINVKLHFIREVVNSKQVKVEYVDTLDNGADMFTKALGGSKFQRCLELLGVS